MTEQFIEKAREVHGDKYDYSKVEYIKNNEKVIILCKEHGEFLQTPQGHLSGRKCIKCSGKYSYSNEEWIVKAKEIHGEKYDYSKVEYKKAHQPIIIICKSHGEFIQNPNVHLRPSGCKLCGFIDSSNKQSKTKNNEEWIVKAKEIHGDKYDYSKVDYKNNNVNVIIICKQHGEFKQQPNKHLHKQGCIRCCEVFRGKHLRKDTETFIKQSQEIHGNKYDYSKTEYTTSKNNVIIICKIHGEFQQLPNSHLRGCGCVKCSGKGGYTHTLEQFIGYARDVHGDKYDYSKVLYLGTDIKVIILCKIHGVFSQRPNSHLQGKGCIICGGCNLKNTESFIKQDLIIGFDSIGKYRTFKVFSSVIVY